MHKMKESGDITRIEQMNADEAVNDRIEMIRESVKDWPMLLSLNAEALPEAKNKLVKIPRIEDGRSDNTHTFENPFLKKLSRSIWVESLT